MSTNKQWFSKAKIGLFTSYMYLVYQPGSPYAKASGTCKSAQDLTKADSLDQLADSFDARKFARAADSMAYPTPSRSVLTKEHWGVATQSLDSSKTYLHVLNAPPSNVLRLPEPSKQGCKWHFTCAEIMGREAGIEKTDDGWAVTLPDGMNWDAEDTVVTLLTEQIWG